MTKTKLGRGLGALLPQATEEWQDMKPGKKYRELEVALIDANPYQPRQVFIDDSIKELAQSILENGLIQPIIVIKQGLRYQLIAGERRLRACKLLNMEAVPAIVRNETPDSMLELAIVENVQRDNLNPYDEAVAYQKLAIEFGYTQEKISQKVSKSRTYVTNLIRMLDLPQEILEGIQTEKITEGHARALLQIKDNTKKITIYHRILAEKLSVRSVEQIARSFDNPEPSLPVPSAQKDTNNLSTLQQTISNITKVPVKIKGNHQRGEITLTYQTINELNQLLSIFQCPHISNH